MKKTLFKTLWKTCLSLALSALLLLGAVGGMSGCGRSEPPLLEDVYDRIVEVVEASHEVNVLLFGAGLPVYPRGDAEDELLHRYYGVTDNGTEFVTHYAKYATLSEMQAAIAAVYSEEYRASLEESLFTGYADSEYAYILPARYSEGEHSLCQSIHVDPLVTGVRLYDYAAMEILEKDSTANRIRVAIPSYTDSTAGEWKTVYLSFVYENGNWFLDSPSC